MELYNVHQADDKNLLHHIILQPFLPINFSYNFKMILTICWSTNLWLTSGDCNTSFFHAKASSWLQRNIIRGLCDEADFGRGLSDEAEFWQDYDRTLEQITIAYLSNIFWSNEPTDSTAVVDAMQPRVTEVMNATLTQDFRAGK